MNRPPSCVPNAGRRRLLFSVAALAAGARRRAGAADAGRARPLLCLFSKHLPKLNYSELGQECRRFGFDGVDLTVRPGGHVLPENVERDLPLAKAAIEAAGMTLPMITTGLTSTRDPAAEPTLRTAGRLGIPYFKIGYTRYRSADVLDVLAANKRDTAALVELAARHGVAAGYHNHSGDYVGSPVWDIHEIIRDLDPRWIGYYFDPCHATAEGGLAGWRLALNIALKRLKMVALKDFYWRQDEQGRWRMQMCPMGKGMVDWDAFFSTIAKAGFRGPMSLHVEYDPPDEPAAIAADLAFMKRMVEKHYE